MQKHYFHILVILTLLPALLVSKDPSVQGIETVAEQIQQKVVEQAMDQIQETKDGSALDDSTFQFAGQEDMELTGSALESSDIYQNQSDTTESPELELIEFQFEDVSLYELTKYVGELFDITFLFGDLIEPLPEATRSLKGNRVTFRSHVALTKTEAWNLFTTFLDLAGFTVVPGAQSGYMRIVQTDRAIANPLPTFISSPLESIPQSDEVIRYIYFIYNSTIEALKPVTDVLKSATTQIIALQEHKAFLIIDKASNVKALVEILRELDKVSMPQSLSVLRLQQADAANTKDLLDKLTGADEGQAQRFGARRQPTTLYFPDDVKIIAEVRSNSLIMLGRSDSIAKLEEFVQKHIDKDPDKPYSPLYVYPLKYAEASAVAEIMQDITAFGQETEAGKEGGVRAGDKFLKPMTFTPENRSNSLIIRGDYEDYLKVVEVLREIDQAQPQVAVEVLILTLQSVETRALGAQLRSKRPANGMFNTEFAYQTSGLNVRDGATSPIIENPNVPGALRLIGDLVDALTGITRTGSTFVTLGDKFGVWAIFQALEVLTGTDILAHPFLIATNKRKARVSVGETRRVVVGTVVGADTQTPAFGDENANLTVEVTPQINDDGLIILNLKVALQSFLSVTDPANVAKSVRIIETTTTLANNEVLALGGLIQDAIDNSQSNVPLVGRIPIIGWAFKNRFNRHQNDTLLILLSARIVDPSETDGINSYTQGHIADYYNNAGQIYLDFDSEDPINKIWFDRDPAQADHMLDQFIKVREHRLAEKHRREKTKTRTKKRGQKRDDFPIEQAIAKMYEVQENEDQLKIIPEQPNA